MLSNLLHHYPFRYEDLRDFETGTILESKNIYTHSGKTVQKISVRVGNKIRELTYFNQPFLIKTLRPGVKISLAGTEYEVNGPLIHTGRLVPVYPETKGISSKWIRRQIYNQLKKPIGDWLPAAMLEKYHLIDLNSALRQIHFPDTPAAAETAKRRLAFDELLEMQLLARQKRQSWKKKLGNKLAIDKTKLNRLIKSLPFKLTASQNRSLEEIMADLASDQPMNRLLQGEVGSGKTVVAALAMYLTYLNGLKSILMAPTEILVEQHYQTLKSVFSGTPVKIGRVTKSIKETGDILIGTHALLNRKVDRLGLVVIDEQHRFGVKQRSKLVEIKPRPHLLSMTATPIPRTLALTLYAHLDLSSLDDLPGRLPVKTWLVPQEKRQKAYYWIKQQIAANQSQAFIVCPLINPSAKESMQDIKDITTEFEKLTQVFDGLTINLIHGRLPAPEKSQIIQAFSRGKTKILVATPVIEVGIDIAGADIIIIENAERFGLAQLHQLRGRVGRRGQTAYCLLFCQKSSLRLAQLQTISSGIKLAELDLKLRGEGRILGLDQHGFSQFKLADLNNLELIILTREAAAGIISSCRRNQNEKFHQGDGVNVVPALN
ncbi:MAG: ATP-dependent DNA helicase RecG [Candidatus Beckwithbacteria bacterium GW2011_GWC2_47_9]|uniref:ATP-dependent DNA helicase RecG n=1 Tax=Candidatus Beckwithbacteria bacterium GW2011_GWC2_47_9 TaxID=1618373 RepID=A0A0G1TYH8_9BACT|nr:MAG: ATP-dependent DNA helicase RecG [Candidatus Beckwithbacteria bacterium GW2011_GWC2_47_9]